MKKKLTEAQKLRIKVLEYLATLPNNTLAPKWVIAKKVNSNSCSVYLEQALKTVKIRRVLAQKEIGELGGKKLVLSRPITYYQLASFPMASTYNLVSEPHDWEL